MSSVADNKMGPVKDGDAFIEKISEHKDLKHAALHALYEKHKENKTHHFKETDHKQAHIDNWKVLKYAEEEVAYGFNYFLKVKLHDDLCIHIRIHRQKHHDVWDFYSLHETIKHNQATCVWSEKEPLTYFNA